MVAIGDTIVCGYPGKNIVFSGNYDVEQEVTEQFVVQSGLGEPGVADWLWSDGEVFGEGEPGVYYSTDMEDRYLAEVEGAIYNMLVNGSFDTQSEIYDGLTVVCETPHCVCLILNESGPIVEYIRDSINEDVCKDCLTPEGCETCEYGECIEDKISE
jgi:hypothetical protein